MLIITASIPGIDGRIYNALDDAPISVAELLQLHNSEILSEALHQDYYP
ncbi:hypothetical protein [Paenibacillus sp. Leaf72]|nr:hypothetical protein [Paenibacillus sp. Leaf72]